MNLGMHSFILRPGDEILACFPTYVAEWLQLGMLSNHLEDEECIVRSQKPSWLSFNWSASFMELKISSMTEKRQRAIKLEVGVVVLNENFWPPNILFIGSV